MDNLLHWERRQLAQDAAPRKENMKTKKKKKVSKRDYKILCACAHGCKTVLKLDKRPYDNGWGLRMTNASHEDVTIILPLEIGKALQAAIESSNE